MTTTNIGHNKTPAHEEYFAVIREYEIEITPYLTGVDISDQSQADEIGELLGKADAAKKDAEAALKAARAPHQAEVKRLGADYKPAIDSASRIIAAGKTLLGNWRAKLDAAHAAKAAAERAEADRLAEEARQASLAAGADLAAKIAAEEKIQEAKQADIVARVAAKATPTVKIGDRSIRMVTKTTVTVTDEQAAAAWVWKNRRAQLMQAISAIVESAIKHESVPEIPGVHVEKHKEAA